MRQRSAPLIPWETNYLLSTYSGITINDNAAIRNTNACTFMAGLICYNIPHGNYGYIMAECNSGIAGGIRLMVDSFAGPLSITFGADSTGVAGSPYITGSISAFTYGDYVDAVCTYDGGVLSSGMKTYIGINGALATLDSPKGSGDGSGSQKVTAGIPITLGNRPGGGRSTSSSHFYTAKWNRILSLPEIHKVQQFGPLAARDGLLFCWANGRDWGPSDLGPVTVIGIQSARQSPFAPRLRIGRAAFAAEVAAPSFLSAWAHRKSAVIGAGVR